MLLDDLLPTYDVRERHSALVHASAERVYAAVWSANLAPTLVQVLLWVRALPAVLLRSSRGARDAWPRLAEHASGRVTMHDVVARGFTVIAEDPPRELVLGVDGAFWRLRGGVQRVDAASFRMPQPPGTARAAWNFHVARRGDSISVLSTETRVLCADGPSRRRFRLYWLLVRPWSGLIRRLMLGSIRRSAEG